MKKKERIKAYNKKYTEELLNALKMIKPEEVMAIGDNMNDKEMIQNSGLGVVMGNSNPIIKEMANVIVSDNNSEGVLEAINRFILTKKH